MEQLVELLKQIQELAGVAIDALEGASKGPKGEGGPGGEGSPRGEGGAPPSEGGGERKPPAAEEQAEREMPPRR